ncbi:hypothetical protein [Bradyrhizobium sp. 2S1]|uniref:hypothetical protein n=1 Tax=Bradyrhizobium sp. 2S1 TaxID=1404429 RepID=UPI00140B6DAD|nr:hypothetical protein [Bradyrhizobium sp. 2S1]MCK7668181.1 hypothetical protein [Bradyrhizobium sp. 2S1]
MKHQVAGLLVSLLRIVIANDDDMSTHKKRGQVIVPLASATGIACGRDAEAPEPISIFLALDNDDPAP